MAVMVDGDGDIEKGEWEVDVKMRLVGLRGWMWMGWIVRVAGDREEGKGGRLGWF
jgi:hypothetical protein